MFLLTKTLLIDGNYLIKRSHFGAKNTYNSRGQNIGVLFGFMIMLRKLIKEHNINKVVVFFDGENSGFERYKLYPLYKSNRESKSWYNKIELTDKQAYREEEEKSLLWQKVRIQQYLENLFIRQIEVELIEADDLIAKYCIEHSINEHIIIYSNDADYCQLLNLKNVSIYLESKKCIITRDNYFINFKHDIQNAKLLKILCGCDSDFIKGVSGLGEQTLITHFPEIKRRKVELQEVIDKAKVLNEERVKNKKKPLKVLENIHLGVFNDLGEKGIEHYDIHDTIIDLHRPMLTPEACEELEDIATLPLDIEGRTSKHLLTMMTEDGFLLNFPNADFNNFVNPFVSLIIKEKELAKKM